MKQCEVFDDNGNPEFIWAAQVSARFGLVGNSPIRCDFAASDSQSAFWLGQADREAAKSPEIIINKVGLLEVDKASQAITFSNIDPQIVGDWINGVRAAMTMMAWRAESAVLPLE